MVSCDDKMMLTENYLSFLDYEFSVSFITHHLSLIEKSDNYAIFDKLCIPLRDSVILKSSEDINYSVRNCTLFNFHGSLYYFAKFDTPVTSLW